jgi:predicted O-methyltransferase YrrM
MTTLQHLRNMPVRVLEIGSFEGLSTTWFLHFFAPDSRITCIDTFKCGPLCADAMGVPYAYMIGLQERFFDNVAFGRSRLDVRIGQSETVMFTLQPGSFDVIYVDGSHHAADALTDIVMAFHLLKTGGLMMIDDVEFNDVSDELTLENIQMTPRLAVQPFITLFQERIEVLYNGYQVHLKKLR